MHLPSQSSSNVSSAIARERELRQSSAIHMPMTKKRESESESGGSVSVAVMQLASTATLVSTNSTMNPSSEHMVTQWRARNLPLGFAEIL